MTFSICAKDESTGMLGMAVSSSSPAVAARCAYARAAVGAVGSQNITDPSLGERCLDLMQAGASASEAVAEIVNDTRHIAYRQLTAVDAKGDSASFSGEHTLGIYSTSEDQGVVCAGNMLANTKVPEAMVTAFKASAGQAFGDRLLGAMLAGLDAGGEAGPVHSAGLLMVDKVSWPVASLRVDWSEAATPLQELQAVWKVYAPQLDDYVQRALDPSEAPSYGVPGDE